MNHKSTTHQEEYFHIIDDLETLLTGHTTYLGTVFMRREVDGWYASIAVLHHGDQFCRRVGRNVARRRYFARPSDMLLKLGIDVNSRPTYEDAEQAFIALEGHIVYGPR